MAGSLRHCSLERRIALFFLLLIGLFAGRVQAQDQSSPIPLPACRCDDIPRLKDRLDKLLGIQKLIARKLQSTHANAPATQADWNSFQSQIDSYLSALQLQNLTSFPDSSLFPGPDPACTLPSTPANTCSEQELAVHQRAHSASCSAGRWNWQSPWSAVAMLQDESAALQAEIDAISETIDRLPCKPCPQFVVTVQVVTNTAIAQSGMTERSSRSLNGGEGIKIPLTLKSDGTFQGAGTGIDAGTGMGATADETVSGGFAHMQAIYASGTIQAGVCNAPACTRDTMHLTLTGGSSQQITEMQARGVVNRNFNQATPTGAATMSFDLPAYVGATAQRTLLANSLINSVMQVTLGQANAASDMLPAGSSLLYSTQQCRNSGAPDPQPGREQ